MTDASVSDTCDSAHLPECPAGYVADLCTTDIDPVLQEPTCNHCVGQGCICICNRLRACEQRVLDAAREAVARLQHKPGASIANAVSVIDALSENPDDLPVSENPNDAR